MDLHVPSKWSHLNYSQLGNPLESELDPKKYLPGDMLYSKDHPDYLMEGKRYFSAEGEKEFLEFYKNREAINLITSHLLIFYRNDFSEYFSDINNAMFIDEETGVKVLNFFDDIHRAHDSLCPNDTSCSDIYKGDISRASRVFSETEYYVALNFFKDMRKGYAEKIENQALRTQQQEESKRYLCRVEGTCLGGDSDHR